jgi:hypothetical protein
MCPAFLMIHTAVTITVVQAATLLPVAKKLCRCKHGVRTSTLYMFILKRYFTSKLVAAAHEAFSNAYSGRILNKTKNLPAGDKIS